ncbi:hypothetical protein PT2222_200015 [Paraburkholderia tropica]
MLFFRLIFRRRLRLVLHDAAADLVEFDRFEQRLEVAFAEALIALALDDLEEDRADLVLREDLQQQVLGRAVDQDLALFQLVERLGVARNAAVHQFVIRVDGVEQRDIRSAQAVHRAVDVAGAERDVLNAFAVIRVQIFLDLTGRLAAFLVDRNTNLAARRGHRLRLHARHLAFDVEVADFAEVEEAFVELGPLGHAAAMHVVREMVDVGEAVADRILLGALDRHEIDVIDADVANAARLRAVLAAPAVDEIDQRVADALDGRNVQLHRAGFVVEAPCAQFERTLVGLGGVLHTKRDCADRRAVQAREALRERIGLAVDDEVDLALAIKRHVLVAVTRDGGEAHALEQLAERFGIGSGVFDELEAVGADGIFPGGDLHGCLLR